MVKAIRIVAPHFVAGATTHAGRVIRPAPIIHYMRLWTLDEVRRYCARQRWTLEELSNPDDHVQRP